MSADVGAAAPFTFACHRCGHCCSEPDGFVWLADGEVERLAQALSSDPAAIRQRAVRQVLDPNTGELREALRDREDGACVLLEGQSECSAYGARPEHCRTFPFWSSILAGGEPLERAREICPGIHVEADDATRQRAFTELEALYAELEEVLGRSRSVCLARGVCCRFEEAGHELFSTRLEADFAAARHPEAPAPEAPGRCPYHRAGRCTAREGRPLGCRTYFCDPQTSDALESVHEHFLSRIRDLERSLGYPSGYARFCELLKERGVGT